jgi:hypothetical protein
VRRDYACIVDKRRDCLTWRDTECPDRAYRFLYLRSGFGRILAMACVGIHGGQGRLLEYFPGREDPYAARLLLTLVEEHCTAAGATHLVAWTPTWSSTFRRLQQRGYRQEPTEFHLVARLFHPQLNMDWCLANFEYSLGDCDMF